MQLAFAAKTVVDFKSLATVIPVEILDQGGDFNKVLTLMCLPGWKHMYYTFWVSAEDDLLLYIATRTTITISYDLRVESLGGFLSASVDTWHAAILEFCNNKYRKEYRALFNAILLFLERDGIKFPNLNRLELRDGTFEIK